MALFTRTSKVDGNVSVAEIEDLSPKIRRLRIVGPSIKGMQWVPGQKIKIQAGPKLKSYIPARIDSEQGWMDIIFHLHGNGLASDWASNVSIGEATHYIGPANSMPFIDKLPDWALFFGDETTVGLAIALIDALPPQVQALGAIELEEQDMGALETTALSLTPVKRLDHHGEALLQWLNNATLPDGEGIVWLSGEAGSIRDLKQALIKRGVRRDQLKMKAYWSTKGHAYRKALQKTL